MVFIRKRGNVFGKVLVPSTPAEWLYDPRWTDLLKEIVIQFSSTSSLPPPLVRPEAVPKTREFQESEAALPPPVFNPILEQGNFSEFSSSPKTTCCNTVETFYFNEEDACYSAYEVVIPDYVTSFLVTLSAGGAAGSPSHADSSMICSGFGGGGGGGVVNFPVETSQVSNPLTLFVGQGGNFQQTSQCDVSSPLDCDETLSGDGYSSFIIDSKGHLIVGACGGKNSSQYEGLGGVGGKGPFPGGPGDPFQCFYPSVDSRLKIEAGKGGAGGVSIFNLGGEPGQGSSNGKPGKLGSGGGGAGTGFFMQGGKGGDGVIILKW
jgi:hypothetical protein